MTLIAQSHWFENKDASELLLIFGIFFAVLAFITLVCWIIFAGDRGGSQSSSEHYSNRSSSDHSRTSGQPSSQGYNASSSGIPEMGHSRSEVRGYSSTSEVIHSTPVNQTSHFDYDSMPEMSQFSRKQAEEAFRDDIFNSFARWDDAFGVIYIVPPGPKSVDDLTAINGISHEFQRELHRVGIFMYKQIASWPNETCRNISRELNSGDLLFRQNWPEQSRRLHFEKYREEITPVE